MSPNDVPKISIAALFFTTPNWKAQRNISKKMEKQIVVHLYDEILLSSKTEKVTVTTAGMKLKTHYAE